MSRAWRIRWEFFLGRRTMRGLARRYKMPVAQIERIIRTTDRDWRRLRR